MSFRLVPKSLTLNDFERHNGPYSWLFHQIRVRRVAVKQLLGGLRIVLQRHKQHF